jgi:hypothetical protein
MKRAKDFYESILEIHLQDLSIPDTPKMSVFPVENGTVGGALCEKNDLFQPGQNGPVVYLNANPNLQTVLQKIVHLGGKVILPKTKINDEYGYMAIFEDCEGNRVALHSMG